jgi:hypothetical protein
MSPIYPVSSSNVESVWTDGNDLFVKFLAKGRWPSTTYYWPGAAGMLQAMLASPSKGKFVHWQLEVQYGKGIRV